MARDQIYSWLADRLPRRLIHWAVVRAWNCALFSDSSFNHTKAKRLTVDTMLNRWNSTHRKIRAAETTGKEVAI